LENIGKFGDPAVCGAIEIAPWHDKHKTPGVIVADTAAGLQRLRVNEVGAALGRPLAQF
jgi:hypothetical protein